MPAWYHAVFARAALATALLGASSSGCGGKAPPKAGVSTANQPPRGPAHAAGTRRDLPPWLALSSLSALPLAAAETYPALGHLPGQYTAQVRVSEPARESYLALSPERELPSGSVVAQFLRDVATGASGPVFVMRKHDENDWLFAVLGPDGTPLDWGRLPLCLRCHDEAPQGHLFGLPRASDQTLRGQ
jgi:hypothetical protein